MLNALPLAHVKWFTDFDWSTPPRAVSEITSATFWSMLALSIVTILVMVLVDRWMQRTEPLSGLTRWFEAKSGSSLLVMRVALFSTLLVAWQQ